MAIVTDFLRYVLCINARWAAWRSQIPHFIFELESFCFVFCFFWQMSSGFQTFRYFFCDLHQTQSSSNTVTKWYIFKKRLSSNELMHPEYHFQPSIVSQKWGIQLWAYQPWQDGLSRRYKAMCRTIVHRKKGVLSVIYKKLTVFT